MKIRLITLFLFSSFIIYGQSDLFILEKLNVDINTPKYDEITPVVSKDGKTLCFTRVAYPIFNQTLVEKGKYKNLELPKKKFLKHLAGVYSEISGEKIEDPVNSNFNQDIWIAHSTDDQFNFVSHPEFPLNNALPNSICAITPDENGVIVINKFEKKGGMSRGFSISNKNRSGGWTFPSPIYIQDFNNSSKDVGLSLNTQGTVLLLALEQKGGQGDIDLYVCFKTGVNSWSKPVNLGDVINTPYRELTPFLSIDNLTLYFSSNRKGTIGGNDIFYSKRLDDTWTKWSEPKRLDAPINSKFDEAQPFFNMKSGYIYFSSNRDGSSDIFRVRIEKPIKETVSIKGKILNPKNEKMVVGAIVKSGNSLIKNYRQVDVAEDGTYAIEIKKGEKIDIFAEKEGFFSNIETVEFKKNYFYFRDYEVNLILEPIEGGTKLRLKPIFFEQSKAKILEKSFPAINELADYLEKNKSFYVVIEGHTDNQGTEKELIELSEKRAEAIKDYLVYKKFINPVRLETIGYGGSKPLTDNSTNAERAKNRRVEVTILTVAKILKK